MSWNHPCKGPTWQLLFAIFRPNARGAWFLLLVAGLVLEPVPLATFEARASASPSVTYLREGNDFATRVLGDPWNMNEFADISTSLNNAGRTPFVANWSVS